MLMRSDPFRQLDRVADQMLGTLSRPAAMPMDAYRRGDSFVVNFDLPGVDPEQVELTVDRNTLTVKAERGWSPAQGDEVMASERPQGVFSRQLLLGEGLDTERIEANYDRGVLSLTIPVAEHAKPRRVAVSSGEGPKSINTTAT